MNPYDFGPNRQSMFNRQQEVVRVHGKASVDMIQLPPNSSMLAMDDTAPIVWLCVSDGVGRVVATPYDISPHQDPKPVDVASVEFRLGKIEESIKRMEERFYEQSNAGHAKQNHGSAGTNSGYAKSSST